MRRIVLDIETDGLNAKTIWVIVAKDIDTNEIFVFKDRQTMAHDFREFMTKVSRCIMHNGLAFDAPIIKRLLNVTISHNKITDTLILARLANSVREGGNSLANWGTIFNYPKIDYDDWSHLSDEMITYCKRDVDITHKLYEHLKIELSGFSKTCIDLEFAVASLINIQCYNGFYLNSKKAMELSACLQQNASTIETELVSEFDPVEVKLKTKTKYVPFNPNSRKQIGERLELLGWIPEQKTDKTQRPVINEKTLETCPLPVARKFQRLFLLNKRLAQVNSWLESVNPETGRVHGNVKTIGTITGRMTHNNPNMAQVPASYSPYGKECRDCWTVEDPKRFVLVGADASGLELRCLAHYMNDEEFTKEVVDGDIHTANQKAAGLPTRDNAKTFIYAFLYGAGAAKIGAIIEGDQEEGQQLIDTFLNNMPKLAQLRERVTNEAGSGRVRALDGRFLMIRHVHAALNTLLQGAGAIICKQWLIEICKLVFEHKLTARPVANIHDEVQFEVLASQANQFSDLTREAMKKTEDILKTRCPLDSEAKIGLTWSTTH